MNIPKETRWNATFSRVALYAILLLFVGFYLLPIEAGLVTSLKTNQAVTQTEPYLPPTLAGFTLESWLQAFELLKNGLINSFAFAIPATVISALLGSMAAYGLTHTKWRGQALVLAFFIAGIFIPIQAALIPLSKFWSVYVPLNDLLSFVWQLPLLEPHHADLLEIIITHIGYGIPICVLLFRSYYKGISTELIEAARLDGASVTTIYRRIVLPLSWPMFVVTFIYQFTGIWNDLLFALILVSSSNSPAAPITLILAGLGESLTGVNFPLRMAGAFITSIPTLLVYILFGEQFARGVAT
ncbi:carbohydrate ABC transporter permease [Haloferax sp. Atlit-4N]|uniref:carbohydrate ABC transporter permease n=1 Tax=unclassified Haloferax TaxID=2625095 RepID=UPI000E22C203|nr:MULTISPECIES: carbohydrate ABC transporter permease [unclassified Haloferax]RDZ39500.1 carbohydrate ABC transporter permease [Haloferax sp. Atlit-19N]RDZ50224.1 carbohydrate ABC transporter permease [Haloferax sp. Atlit-4N]